MSDVRCLTTDLWITGDGLQLCAKEFLVLCQNLGEMFEGLLWFNLQPVPG